MSLLLAAATLLAANAPLTVEVAGVPNARGRVRIDVCPQAKFLGDGCQWNATAPAKAGTVTITIPDLPPGEYAIQAFHDANSNDEMDQGLFGIPKEAFGFSRDPKVLFSAPKWKDAMFTHGAAPDRQGLTLHKWGGGN